jgi:hypothetical protein
MDTRFGPNGRSEGAVIVALIALALGAGCGEGPAASGEGGGDTPTSARAQADVEQSFADACDAQIRATHGPGFPGACTVSSLTRTVIDAGHAVVEYSVEVRVGTGAHDVIGLHRVVRESSPFQAEPSKTAVMLIHGDAWPFRAAFLDTGGGDTFAAFLAQNGVDVWGIDLRWTGVPADTADLSFMRTWGMPQDAGDLGVALSVAHLYRQRTGEEDRPLRLLGWSRGGQLGYAYVAHEATLPLAERHVDGFVPVDVYLTLDPETPEGGAARDGACQRLAADLTTFDDATRSDHAVVEDGSAIAALGQDARDAPSDAHRRAALLAGEKTFALPGGPPPTPRYHFTGGTFDADGNPTGLTYTDEARWFAAAAQASPYEPLQLFIDAERVMCEGAATGLDPVSAIRVPILYVGAGGGFGRSGLATAALTGSPDERSLVVSLAADPLNDVGHADIFLARSARSLFWEGILDWLTSLRPE